MPQHIHDSRAAPVPPRLRAAAAPVLGLLLLAVAACPAGLAVAGDDADVVRAGLKKNLEFSKKGSLIRQLTAELEGSGEWIQRAILYVELGNTQDRRAVEPLSEGLESNIANVSAFALHALTSFSKNDLRKGGGGVLFDRLVRQARSGSAFHARKAHAVLRTIVGVNLGETSKRWLEWKERFAAELSLESLQPPFDASRHDPAVVAKVKSEPGDDTVAFPRIPPVTEYVTRLRKQGLDVVLCLDQTGSMSSVIQATKSNIELMMLTLREVLRDFRVGLVTYDDQVQRVARMTTDIRSLRLKLNKVLAAGGEDYPEGVDKALARAYSSRLGWRGPSVKTIVLLGDAPPHQPDVEGMLAKIEAEYAKRNIIVNAVSTAPTHVAWFQQIADKGGGRAIVQRRADGLITEVLILILGEGMRPAMQRFVPVLIEIVKSR